MNCRLARRVVMTRQPEQAGDLERGLLAAGHTVQFLPLTDFELPVEIAELRRAVGRLVAGDYAWLVLTSPNTVRALVRVGWDGRLPHTTRVAVTGPGTARVLAAAGCSAAPWMPDGDASAAGIIAAFPTGPGQTTAAGAARVLLPQSALATEEVAAALRSRGWSVDRLEAYRTVPYPAAADRRLLEGPGAAAPLSPRPVHRDPARTDPAISDPARTDPASSDPARTDAARSHPARTDPASSDPARAEAAVVGLADLAGAVVVLTSPSAVRELTRQRGAADAATGARFVAIGQPTRRAAEAAGLGLSGTARTPDANGILALL